MSPIVWVLACIGWPLLAPWGFSDPEWWGCAFMSVAVLGFGDDVINALKDSGQ